MEVGLVVWAALTSAAVTVEWLHAVRPIVVLPFILFVPGWALVQIFGFDSALTEIAVAVPLSIGLLTLVATAFSYAGIWSPPSVLATLVLITLTALIVGRIRRRR